MPAIERALIIGGGIGGLTAGVALRQAGIAVDLVEINPTFSVYGVGIIQPNNTLRALDRIGLARRCVELGAPFPGWRIHDAAGNFIMDAPNETTAAPDFPPNNGITRPDLQRVLSEAAYADGVAIRLGTKVETITDRGDRVDVRLSDGSSGSYDLVIGSDGLYSDTRRRIFGDDVTPQFTGQSVWRYNFPRPKELVWGEIHAGPRSKVGLTPIRPDLMYMFVVSAEPGNPWMPQDRLAELMRERLAGFSGLVAELGEQIVDPAGVVYKPMENLLLPAPWNKGRVLIIGDAAHATTPHLAQGAAMAIEDAVLLGELLGRGEGTFETTMEEFMARRFDRARFVIESSDQIAQWEMESWRGIDNPDARPGEILHHASVALLEDY
jgi:2-polyprenyl-6-methoxyphenol hydroxylase-like FAD-dependent oxidoreductase